MREALSHGRTRPPPRKRPSLVLGPRPQGQAPPRCGRARTGPAAGTRPARPRRAPEAHGARRLRGRGARARPEAPRRAASALLAGRGCVEPAPAPRRIAAVPASPPGRRHLHPPVLPPTRAASATEHRSALTPGCCTGVSGWHLPARGSRVQGSTALWSWQQNPRRHQPGMRKAPRASDAPEPGAGAVRPIAAEPPAQRLSVTQRPRLRCGRKEAARKRGRGRAAGRRRVGRVPDVKAPPWPRPAAVGGAGAWEPLGPRGPGPLCGRAAGGATGQGRGRTGQRGAVGSPPAPQPGRGAGAHSGQAPALLSPGLGFPSGEWAPGGTSPSLAAASPRVPRRGHRAAARSARGRGVSYPKPCVLSLRRPHCPLPPTLRRLVNATSATPSAAHAACSGRQGGSGSRGARRAGRRRGGSRPRRPGFCPRGKARGCRVPRR